MTDQSVTDQSVTDESVTDESVTKPSALAKARIDRAVYGFQQILDEGILARPDFGLDGHAGKHRIAAGGDTLTGNPAGTITLADGSEITFQGVEEIQW